MKYLNTLLNHFRKNAFFFFQNLLDPLSSDQDAIESPAMIQTVGNYFTIERVGESVVSNFYTFSPPI